MSRRRTIGLVAVALLVLVLIVLSCSISQVLATRLSPTVVPTRTPRPTWTRQPQALSVATPTLDPTRYPVAPVPTARPVIVTPQAVVAGQPQPFIIQAGTPGQVMTVVIVIVTATPPAPAQAVAAVGTPVSSVSGQPGSRVPSQPLLTPTVTNTPPPAVVVHVTTNNAFVRQGPGVAYPPVTQLDQNTTITVVGRNRAGDWWKICCVNGADVWIADQVVKVDGPLWTVPEALNIPPSPMPTPTPPAITPTITPTPTSAWPFHVLVGPYQYPLGQNYFKVAAIIFDGATPSWGYKLRIRQLSTGKEWFSDGSEAFWKTEPIEWDSNGSPKRTIKRNVKWDSNSVSVPLDGGSWEVTVTDGAGTPVSEPVRITPDVGNSNWYYIVFTSRR